MEQVPLNAFLPNTVAEYTIYATTARAIYDGNLRKSTGVKFAFGRNIMAQVDVHRNSERQ